MQIFAHRMRKSSVKNLKNNICQSFQLRWYHYLHFRNSINISEETRLKKTCEISKSYHIARIYVIFQLRCTRLHWTCHKFICSFLMCRSIICVFRSMIRSLHVHWTTWNIGKNHIYFVTKWKLLRHDRRWKTVHWMLTLIQTGISLFLLSLAAVLTVLFLAF